MRHPGNERSLVVLNTFANSQSERLLHLPEGYAVVLGIPPKLRKDFHFGGDELTFPIRPHVFRASHLRLSKNRPLSNIVVLVAHGGRNDNNQWEFGNRQPVVETVLAYNKFARTSGYPQVEAVLVCNRSSHGVPAHNATLLEDEGIIFPIHEAIFPHITYKDGKVDIIASVLSENGFANVRRFQRTETQEISNANSF